MTMTFKLGKFIESHGKVINDKQNQKIINKQVVFFQDDRIVTAKKATGICKKIIDESLQKDPELKNPDLKALVIMALNGIIATNYLGALGWDPASFNQMKF